MEDLEQPQSTELISSFNESDFAKEVFSQLTKEFGKVGILIEFNEDDLATFEAFKERLSEELDLIMRSSSNRVDQLFYLADIPESKVKTAIQDAENPVDELAKMLLVRAAEKVNFKRKYKLGLL
ncbi:hypothetical protein [Brumimicrobium aurantiacum]|uniref:Uncharacterized protein n=1 Tax=Brumimicrobium aurantiacum TaxID=1737063 RepID=A0A3E1EY60_9FLAO|nr:hypothetical protein [Brumimicrobium aurantiacum]RFC54491.1 hypothetical protein DXU93_08715 [Brumimicrobium aurantiacum]